jgi:TonB-linked outer membrane protein, SusC/RagA family
MQAQERKVTGVVTGTNNEPLPGVSISIKGTQSGYITDINGKYSISVPDDNAILVFSFIGYTKEEISVAGKAVIDVTLKEELSKLDEVVVVGYGVQKKSLVTGAISKISGEDLTKSANFRASQLLQGQAAGVLAMSNSGQPGSGVSVNVRGLSTNGNSEPLYIIDGAITSDAGLDFLNPGDIESVEVLKDAASSAIYGTKGANGVVIITTKKGKEGTKKVTYNGYYGVQNPWRKLDVLNSKEYMTMINEAAANANKPAVFSPATMAKNQYNTDWQDEMFNYNAPVQSHSLAVSGGDDKSSYYSSLTYYGQDGIVAKGNSNFQRISFHLDASRKLGFLEMGSTLNFANITNKGIDPNNQYGATSLIQALNTPPIVPVKNPDGSWGTPVQYIGSGLQEITNPVAMLSYLNNTTNTNKAIGGVYGNFDFGKLAGILKGLTFRTSFNTEYSFVNGRGFTPSYYLDATHYVDVNSVYGNMHRYVNWTFDNILTYDRTFQNHHFTVMLGQSAHEQYDNDVSGSRNQYIFNDLDHAYLNNAQAVNASVGGGFYDYTLASYFGRLNYDYQNKYLLTATLRRDGSSNFGSNNRYALFPSFSAGWIISNENFMKTFHSPINYLKLRGSWGQNGNDQIGSFMYTSLIGTGSNYYFGTDKSQYNGAVPQRYANPDLKWEASEQLDFGLDMGLWQNKVSLTLDYYNKTTKDWLLFAPWPSLIGNSVPASNGGDVRNSGFEFDLKYKTDFHKFHFEVGVLGAFNKNKVVDIPTTDNLMQAGNGGFGQNGILVFKKGEPAGSFYGFKTDGLFQNVGQVNTYTHQNTDGTTSLIQPNAQPGDVKFVDQNGDGKLDDKDRVILGSPIPDFTGGVNLKLEFKGFDLGAFMYVSLGNKIWDATRRYDINYTNFRSEALNRWIGEGSSNSYPRVTLNDANGNWSTPSDLFVKDASYMRLRTLTLGYTIPAKLTQFIKVQKLRVYISGENLLTLTKYKGFDPEIGGGWSSRGIDYGNYPQARTILGGISVSF